MLDTVLEKYVQDTLSSHPLVWAEAMASALFIVAQWHLSQCHETVTTEGRLPVGISRLVFQHHPEQSGLSV